jgi:hypothetical protein
VVHPAAMLRAFNSQPKQLQSQAPKEGKT